VPGPFHLQPLTLTGQTLLTDIISECNALKDGAPDHTTLPRDGLLLLAHGAWLQAAVYGAGLRSSGSPLEMVYRVCQAVREVRKAELKQRRHTQMS
jgi:hypothetical protein